jgi:antitoxin component of MazEF toxin-antitoxin module
VRLPRHIVESAKLAEGESVNFSIEDGALVIRPTRKRFKLADLLNGYQRSEIKSDEVDWGQPKGDEAW